MSPSFKVNNTATAATSTTAAAATSHDQSARHSTYSGAPSLHPSIAPTMDSQPSQPVDSARNTMIAVKKPEIERSHSTASSSARSNDLQEWAATFERMCDQRLEKQRFLPSTKKTDEISTNALGAKLERALGRRMAGQDAVFKRRDMNEKGLAVAAS